MKLSRDIICRCLIPVAVVLMLCGTVTAGGIGMMPTEKNIEDAMRGEYSEFVIMIINPGEKDNTYQIVSNGNIKDWFSFYDYNNPNSQIDEILVPASSNARVITRVTVPEDTANGNYVGEIFSFIKTDSVQELNSGTTLMGSTTVNIDITGEEKLSGRVSSIVVDDTEEGAPIVVAVNFENTGNIVAKPRISAVILKDGEVTNSFSDDETEVKPKKSASIVLTGDPSGLEAGNYTADVTVLLNSKTLEEKEIEFEILKEGILTRQGSFAALNYEGTPETGTLLKIVGEFHNTGSIPTGARMAGEIYKDGNLLETISSDEIVVPVYSSEDITSYFQIEDTGNYRIVAHVLYEGIKTDERELNFAVTGSGTSKSPSSQDIPLPAGIAIAALGIGAVLYICRQRT